MEAGWSVGVGFPGECGLSPIMMLTRRAVRSLMLPIAPGEGWTALGLLLGLAMAYTDTVL